MSADGDAPEPFVSVHTASVELPYGGTYAVTEALDADGFVTVTVMMERPPLGSDHVRWQWMGSPTALGAA